jgi:hypothetical protein
VSDPLAALQNIAAKAWRRAAAVPRRGVRLTRRATRLQQQAASAAAEWQLEREIAAVARGRGPIVAGPWLSEVGFEVLYWIPFLRWFEDRYRVNPARVIAVSRGGVADWYGDVAGDYLEIFEHMTTEEFARRNAERRDRDESGGQKQITRGAFDRELVALAERRVRVTPAAVLHPGLMYRLFNEFWFGHRALDLVVSHTRYVPLAFAPAAAIPLPDRYVAVKFYTGTALPDTNEYRRNLREIVRSIAAHTPVVMLDAGMATDEHEDYLFGDLDNVTSLGAHLTPATNLGIQARVIAHADGFVGTCGSLAWLAPMLGVNTVAVYANDRFLTSHVFFARHAYRQVDAARFDLLDLRAAVALDAVTAATAGVAVR